MNTSDPDPIRTDTSSSDKDAPVIRGELRLRPMIIGACFIIVFFFLVARFTDFLKALSAFGVIIRPLTLGLMMAFIMNPVMRLFERQMKKLAWFRRAEAASSKKQRQAERTVRAAATIIAALILVGLVAAFFALVVPQFVEAIRYITDNLNDRLIAVIDWADNLTGYRYHPSMERAKSDERLELAVDTAIRWAREYFGLTDDTISISKITAFGSQLVHSLVNVVAGLFIAIYVLISKERYKGHTKRFIYAMLKNSEQANLVLGIIRKGNDIFYGFIIGKIIDSTIIGIICYVSMLLMRLPYALLCSFVIGVTNIIPIFGPYIGALPTVILIFMTNPPQGIIFLIYIIILQQVDGNLIGPKVLGDSTGVSAFWVMIAIVIGGRLFGFIGMLIGVPVLSLILYIVDIFMGYLAQKKNLPQKADAYIRLDHVDTETGEAVYYTGDLSHQMPLFRRPAEEDGPEGNSEKKEEKTRPRP